MNEAKQFAAYRIGRVSKGKQMTLAGAGERGQRRREDVRAQDRAQDSPDILTVKSTARKRTNQDAASSKVDPAFRAKSPKTLHPHIVLSTRIALRKN